MLARFGLAIAAVFRRVMPDPLVIAIILTILAAGLALAIGDFGGVHRSVGEKSAAMLDAWRSSSGLWYFLAFSMQMCLVLVTGHVVAETRPVRALLSLLADRPASAAQAAAMVGAVACLGGIINWGLGLIIGAILARDTCRSMAARGVPHHAPLIVAAGYTGLMVWHGGLSGSAPLSMTTRDGAAKVLRPEFMQSLPGGGADGIPLSATLFSTSNLVITTGLLLLTPIVLALLAPRDPRQMQTLPHAPALPAPRSESSDAGPVATLPDRLDRSPLIAWLLALPLLAGVVLYVREIGFQRIGLNEVNAAMLALGLALHGSVRSYLAAAEEAARGCAGIILSFPLYGGIMAMLVTSGLVAQLSGWIVSVSTPTMLPLNTFLSAAVLNLFIPSGGGQWAVQGPIALESAVRMGVEPGRLVMAVAYGDQLTNMLQPFWAVPLLAITGARARDIVGYSAAVMLVAGVWIALMLLVL